MTDTYPIIRELDGMHFRIKRGDKWVEICSKSSGEKLWNCVEEVEAGRGRGAGAWKNLVLECHVDTVRPQVDLIGASSGK